MKPVTPCLWFVGDAEAAANIYVSLQIHTRDQAETDQVWSAILANGGK
jgi:predicted 3-demethylubiquinone-9 3-methyltransferase (glyoxalase superfamily)